MHINTIEPLPRHVDATKKRENFRKFWGVVIEGITVYLLLISVRMAQNVPEARQVIPAMDDPQVTFVTADCCCLNCNAMTLTLLDGRVVARMSSLGLKPSFLDYTNRPPEVRKFLEHVKGGKDVPILVIVTPNGPRTILTGVWTTSAVLAALE